MALRIKEMFNKFPIVGGLTDCTRRDHSAGILELLITVGGSTMPIWLGAFIMRLSGKHFEAAFSDAMSHGELFIYAVSIIAPIFYMALYDPPNARAFPSKIWHVLLAGFLMVLSAAAFGFQRASAKRDFTFEWTISKWLFLISVVLLYLAIVYRNMRSTVNTAILKQEEIDFAQGYAEHRERADDQAE